MMRKAITAIAVALSMHAIGASAADKKYDPGASDSEIKIGGIGAYSGPASAYGAILQAETAYFAKLNAEGGINGRKVRFITYDDGFSPPKTVEMARKLVEDDEVLALFSVIGTAPNVAITKYMNAKKVPQLFAASGSSAFANPHNRWTIGFNPGYRLESAVYAKNALAQNPAAKIGVLFQRDDFGRDYVEGIKSGLGPENAKSLVSEISYDVTSPTLSSQIVSLKAAGADIVVIAATPKFAAIALRGIHELGWKPAIYLSNASVSVESVMEPAGEAASINVISAAYRKDPSDPTWKDDRSFKDYIGFMDAYYPSGGKNDQTVYGYLLAQTLAQVLRQCGDDLTHENVIKQAANLRDLRLGMFLPGVAVDTTAGDYSPIKSFQLMRFTGARWEMFGEMMH